MPPPLSRLGAEVAAQQEQKDTERGDADNPKKRIPYVEHNQNFDRYCAESCTFNPDGKCDAAWTAELQPVMVTPTTASTAAAEIVCGYRPCSWASEELQAIQIGSENMSERKSRPDMRTSRKGVTTACFFR